MGLLADIQNDAVNDTTPVSTLLRKVLVLASNLDIDVLEYWVKYEMNGYPSDVDVPEYRQIKMSFKWSGGNIAYQVKGMAIATAAVAHATGIKDIHIFRCRQAIGTIGIEGVTSTSTLQVGMQNYMHHLSGKAIDESYEIYNLWGEFAASHVFGIIDAVRNRVLDFVLTLKKQYPTAGEVDGMTTKEPDVGNTVQHIFNTTINGNAGVIGNANHSTVNFNVNHGNLQDLRKQLTAHGINATDLAELEGALADEPNLADGKSFGPKVGAWLGKMVGKAASGVWNVGLETGGAVLQKALLGYYGLS
ncbi:AbiTii domain-containing protein [Rhizobium lentis]|uniref:AbiTii domain-containing protein n=1 Tax=Rhizobium lentis TaxID=1138194 RepID=UPI001C8382F9|nr:hypothetical protein [Rhizobium lentis]MBX5058988.1 hypothetical protein [Rhizobium lentis]